MVTNNQQNDILMFCYGSNGLTQLSERVETSLDLILAQTVSCEARGYIRTYAGVNFRWENTSVADLKKTNNPAHIVSGLAVWLTQDQVFKLDKWERTPDHYYRDNIELHVYTTLGENQTKQVRGQAYFQTKLEEFVNPSHKYKVACCKTIFTSRKLRLITPKKLLEVIQNKKDCE